MKHKVIDFKLVAMHALERSRSLVPALLPGGRLLGREWVTKNPRRADQAPGSFKINIDSGKWADFATDASGGDLISLVAYLNGSSQLIAARKLKNLIGVLS